MTATFRPPLWATLLLAGFVALCLWAGNWNLDRGQQRQALHDRFNAGDEAPVLSGPVDEGQLPVLRFRQVRLLGRFDSRHQVLIDNMVQNGQAGYQVLTPFATREGRVLVNRGWLPADPDRRILPDVSIGDSERSLTGRLDRLPVPGIRLGPSNADGSTDWPRRMQFPRIEDLEAAMDTELGDYQILLNPEEPDGFQRQWQPGGMGPQRNRAYAVQWFSFAAAAVVIYLVVNLRRGGEQA